MKDHKQKEIERKIDILEESIADIDPSLLKILLQDKTTRKNILWCTKDYESYGPAFHEREQIKVEFITGEFARVIQPRAAKSKLIQEKRIKKRAEVFTPSWVCNEQNNQIDEDWFGRKHVFNEPNGTGWIVFPEKINFTNGKNWKDYVKTKRLEITCGEAPYLVSRYDTTTGKRIPLKKRIGLFDRKMRIVHENCEDEASWLKWSMEALKSVYGYEFQGDSVLIARENLLYDYMDYYIQRFKSSPSIPLLKKAANIISWNIWQMDGLKFVVPYSCNEIEVEHKQLSLFDLQDSKPEIIPCPGCESNDFNQHTGIYCRIFDWTNKNKSISFIDIIKETKNNGRI